MRRSVYSMLTVVLAVLAAACATRASARKAQLVRALDDACLSRTPAEIWPEVQRFLKERDYPLVGADRVAVGQAGEGAVRKLFSFGFQTRVRNDGGRVLETDPRGDTRTRVRVEALPATGGGSRLRVRLVKQVEMSMLDATESRDVDLEVALLERLDPAAAARVTGRQPSTPAATAPRSDRWARVRPLLGSWSGELADGTPVRWRFDFAVGAELLEMRGTPLLFAGTGAHADGEELGRISCFGAGHRFVWNQLANAGRVDRYEASVPPSLPSTADAPLVFVAPAPESLPPGARARLTLRRSGTQLEALLDIAEPGKDFLPAGAVRLRRAP